MDLNQLTFRVKFPMAFQADFRKFWEDIEAPISQSKVLAELVRYDSLVVGENNSFFKGVVLPFASNMIQFIPPESEHFLISSIRIQEGVSGFVLGTDWEAGAVSAALKNAQMTIINNGDTVLQSEPLTQFEASLTTRDIGLVDLKQPIAWIGQTPLLVNVILPAGFLIPANLNLRIELIGIGYIS